MDNSSAPSSSKPVSTPTIVFRYVFDGFEDSVFLVLVMTKPCTPPPSPPLSTTLGHPPSEPTDCCHEAARARSLKTINTAVSIPPLPLPLPQMLHTKYCIRGDEAKAGLGRDSGRSGVGHVLGGSRPGSRNLRCNPGKRG